MRKNGNNGKGDITIDQEQAKAFLTQDTTADAFKDQDATNALRLLMLSDKEFLNNVFKYDVPDMRFCIAMSDQIKECQKHHYTAGVDQALLQLGLMSSIAGKRVENVVKAICGDHNFREASRGEGFKGLMNKIYGGNGS